MPKRNAVIYYGKKVLVFLLSICVLAVMVFYIARLAPGDPLVSYYGDRVEKMTPAEHQWAEEKLGLTAPIHVQYLKGSYGTVDLGATMAVIMMAILPIIIVYLFCQKYIIKGVAAGAVKG